MSATSGEGDGHRAVAFADLAGYTALTEAHGDMSAADVANRFTQLPWEGRSWHFCSFQFAATFTARPSKYEAGEKKQR